MSLSKPKEGFKIPTNDRQLNPRISHFCDIDTGELCRDILENGGKQIGEKPVNIATEMDIFSIQGFLEIEIETLIFKKTGIDINTKEGLAKIERLHRKAIEFYQEELYRLSSKEVKEYNFSNKKSVLDFIKKTSSDSTRRQTICNIIKIMFVVSEFNNAENLHELDEKAINAIQEYFLPHIQILSHNGFPKEIKETKARITLDTHGGGHKVIDFKLKFRPKASTSSILKMLYNPEYDAAELIADAIGIEYECRDEKDIVLVQAYFDDKIYSLYGRNTEYVDKNILSQVDEGERPAIFSSGEDGEHKRSINSRKKGFSGSGYRDFKSNVDLPVTTDLERKEAKKRYTGFEIRGILSDNRNNSGLNDWRIYEQSKKIQAMIRLQGYVTESYIKKVVNEFYNTFPEARFSKEKLLKKYLGDLEKIYFPKTKVALYTTLERFETLSQREGLYPKEITKGK